MGKKFLKTPSLEEAYFIAATTGLQYNGGLNSFKSHKHPLPTK
jgi:hypothetical protein